MVRGLYHRLADVFQNKQDNIVIYELMPLNTDIL